MNKGITSVILSFFVVFVISAQDIEDANKKFDSIYFHVVANIVGQDIDRAFRVADSLYQTSDSELHKVKSLMLLSSLYQDKGELEDALIQAERAEKIASKEKLYDWQARISGFLSTSYRNMGLYERGKTHLDKGLKAGERIENEAHKNIYIGMVYQEKAYYNLAEDNLTEAEQSIILSDEYFQKAPDSPHKYYFLAGKENLLGGVHLKQKKYDSALEHYQRALDFLKNITEENALLKGYVYGGMGEAYLAKEDFEKAIEYLNKSELIAESSGNITLKLEIYDAFSNYYKEIDNYKEYSLYKEKYIEAKNLYESNKQKIVDNLIQSLEYDNKYLYDSSFNLKIGIGVLLFLGLGTVVLYQQKKKKDIKRFNTAIEKLTKEIKVKESLFSNHEEQKDTKENNSKKTIAISEKKEKEIIEGLKEFEQGKDFLERNISLPILAGKLHTNTIYISHILNNHYNNDYNTYINELRIRYIVQKLKENEKYRTYKIGYLADECGFSSHSKFSNVFKSVTGLTPSVFINYLDKD